MPLKIGCSDVERSSRGSGSVLVEEDCGEGRVALTKAKCGRRELGHDIGVVVARGVHARRPEPARIHVTASDEIDVERPIVGVANGRFADAHEFAGREPARASPAHRVLHATD